MAHEVKSSHAPHSNFGVDFVIIYRFADTGILISNPRGKSTLTFLRPS